MDQIDNVDMEYGMPNFAAARAALISPSGSYIRANPVGAIASGIATLRPIMVLSRVLSLISTHTRYLNFMPE